MKYNSKRIYNKKIPDGGAMYNSGPFTIIILDSGSGLDEVKSILSSLSIDDIGTATENITAIASVEIIDNSTATDVISINNNVNISDSAISNDIISEINALVEVAENIKGIDNISIASTFFIVDENSILQPLGVLVNRDSKYELLPVAKEKTEEIPGKHGEIYFGKDYKARALELNVITKNGMTELEKFEKQRLFAKYLDSTKGAKTLIFSDDMEKTYLVKYAGKISFSEYSSWFPFTIPFKMSSPYIMGSFEKILVGSGVAVNDGNVETPLIIKILGPITNPSINIGSYSLSYLGTISTGEEVVIDTHSCTALLNGNANVLDKVNGDLPYYLPVGENTVTADANVTISWRGRWLY